MSISLFAPTYRVDECLNEIRDCLEKGWTGLGYKTVAFEEEWKRYTGFSHAHFVNSATSGLSIAIEVLKMLRNWKRSDEIITTSFTFVAANHAIRYHQLKPVFADVDSYLTLDPADIERKITPRTRAVLFSGIAGNIGDYEQVVQLCQEKGLALILNAAHMAGTRLNGIIPGRDADAVVYSFQADKNLPIADSGMVCFHQEQEDCLARKLSYLGIHARGTIHEQATFISDHWHYDVEHVGTQSHSTSIMAAIGLVQLKYLDQDNICRKQLAAWYEASIALQCPLISFIPTAPNCDSSRYLFMIRVPWRDQLHLHLNEIGIQSGIHYRPNTEYRMYRHGRGQCPHTEAIAKELISLPLHLRMTQEDVQTIVLAIVQFANQQCKPMKEQE